METQIVLLIFLMCTSAICNAENGTPKQETRDEQRQPNPTDQSANLGQQDSKASNAGAEDDATLNNENNDSNKKDNEQPTEYGIGSVCTYCKYCKFCELCDKDCPCEKSSTKPNCHLCKYCSYCPLCTSVCENFCQPGSFFDTISSAIYSALPKFDNKMKEEVNKDIESAKEWIKSHL